jgi:hypothetical protein
MEVVQHQFKREEVSRAELIEIVEPIRAAFKGHLVAGTTVGDGKVKAFS